MAAILCFGLISAALAADGASAYLQKDLATVILSELAWNDGLPTGASDRDLLVILGGKRTFRYEAENAYNESADRVSVFQSTVYGPYTGKGWVRGISEPTTTTLTILVPIKGEYLVKATLKGNGFIWNINGTDFRVDSNSGSFREVEVGKLFVKAGVNKLKVTLPADGAIDSFSLTAPDYPPIQPLIGWRFKEPLTAARLAEVDVLMTNRIPLLPEAKQGIPQPLKLVDVVPPTASVSPTSLPIFGKFAAREWLRTDYRGATIQVPIKVAETGYYGLTANVMGDSLNGAINGQPFSISGKQYLTMVPLGLFRLEEGDNVMTMTIPPTGGIDTIYFTRKDTSPEQFMKLANIKGPADRAILPGEATALVKSLKVNYSIRK